MTLPATKVATVAKLDDPSFDTSALHPSEVQELVAQLKAWKEKPGATESHTAIINRILKDPGRHPLIIARDSTTGTICAVAAYEKDDPQTRIIIYNIVSDPEVRGAARSMVAHLARLATGMGEDWKLFGQALDTAVDFFLKLGFEQESSCILM